MTTNHEARVRATAADFRQAAATFAARVEGIDDRTAERAPSGEGWSVAQIATHLAISNDMFSNILNGTMPMAAPAPAGFVEDWSAISIPDRVKTFPILEPPTGARKGEALERFRISSDGLAKAIEGLPADRATHCVQLPFGTLSLYQFGEFAVRHIHRHLAQIDRALAAA